MNKMYPKINCIIALCVVTVAGAPVVRAQTAADDASVVVRFQQPENFTDLKTSYSGLDQVNEGYTRELRQHLERTAASQLPADYKLEVTITDVDMAGDFEPHRGPQFDDVRIVKDIYPPRIDLRYTLTDASDRVIAQGEEQLRNLSFNWTISPLPQSDPLRYEKALLDDFVREVVKKAKPTR